MAECKMGIKYTCCLVVLLFVVGCGAPKGGLKKMVMKKDDVEKMMKNDMKVGSPKDDIALYLSKKEIEHSYDPKSQKIYAILRKTSKGILVSGNITIEFNLDKAGKLVGFTVAEVYTGP